MNTDRQSGRTERDRVCGLSPSGSRADGHSPDESGAPEPPSGGPPDLASLDQMLGYLDIGRWTEKRVQEFFADVCRALRANRLRVLEFFPHEPRISHVLYWNDSSLPPGVQDLLEKNGRFWRHHLTGFSPDGFLSRTVPARSPAKGEGGEISSLQHVLKNEDGVYSLLLLEDIRPDRRFNQAEKMRLARVHRVIQQWMSLSRRLVDSRHVRSVDRLTGALTLPSFLSQMEWFFRQPDEQPYALVNCSVDRLSEVNDLIGRNGTDELLTDFAGAVCSNLHSGECFGRGEAGVFWALVRFTGRYNLDRRLEKWKREFYERTGRRKNPLNLSLSIGAYVVSEYDRNHPMSCLQKAMFARKVSQTFPSGTVRYYDRRLHQMRVCEEDMDFHMASSLKTHRFLVYLQPKYALSNGVMVGAEALVRWQHPTRGFLMPGDFIPLFERNHFILQLDFYMLEEVCRLIRKWHEQRGPVVPVAVNFSRLHSQTRDFVPRIVQTVQKYGVRPSELEVEMTESAFLEDQENLSRMAGELRRLGFRVAMDDFGLGYSSLNSLESLPIDVLKMDRRFLSPRKSTDKAKVIVRELIHLAKRLNLCVVSEGVEYPWQADFLRGTDCDIVQGFLYSRPVPVETFERMLGSAADPAGQ